MNFAFSVLAIIGIACLVSGIIDIKTSYSAEYREGVDKNHKKIYGKIMGISQVIGGTSVIVAEVLAIAAVVFKNPQIMTLSVYEAIFGLALSVGVFLYGTIKYDSKLF